jgi:hypothetical protein
MLEPDADVFVWNFPRCIAAGNFALNAAGEQARKRVLTAGLRLAALLKTPEQ